MKFRVKGGSYIQGGIEYVKGDVVSSDVDLTALFRGKFERIHEGTPSSEGISSTRKPNIPEPKAKTSPAGKDREANGGKSLSKPEPGDEEMDDEETEEEKEVEVKEAEFEEVDDEEDEEEEEEEEEEKPKEKAKKKLKKKSPHGKRVTSKFPKAGKIGVDVFVKDDWFTIVDRSNGKVLNTKKLSKKKVQPFLNQYLDDDEE